MYSFKIHWQKHKNSGPNLQWVWKQLADLIPYSVIDNFIYDANAPPGIAANKSATFLSAKLHLKLSSVIIK